MGLEVSDNLQSQSQPSAELSDELSRRTLLRRGAKLAYTAPAVLLAMKASPVFASVSGDPLGFSNAQGRTSGQDGSDDDDQDEQHGNQNSDH